MRLPFPLKAIFGIFIVAGAINSVQGGPPEVMRDMPAEMVGRVKTWWLDPFVSITTRSIGPDRWTAVDWFDADGKPTRQLAGYNVYAQAGFVYRFSGGKTTVFGVDSDWKIELPNKPGPAGYITGTDRTFFDEFHPKEGQIAADIYLSGKLVGTIGPYVQYYGQDVRPGEDGSLALVTWRNDERKTAQVIGVGIDGKVRLQTDCDASVMSPIVAADGKGVLVRMNTGGEDRNRFSFYQKSGRVSSLIVGPNVEFVTWLSKTTTALMQTSIGYEYRWHLIDWQTGKQLWEIGDLTSTRAPGFGTPVISVGRYLLFGGLEFSDEGPSRVASRRLYALDATTGRIVAHWFPSPPSQPATDPGRFRKLDNKLYLITDDAFAEINVNDIAAKTNGWK